MKNTRKMLYTLEEYVGNGLWRQKLVSFDEYAKAMLSYRSLADLQPMPQPSDRAITRPGHDSPDRQAGKRDQP